MPSPRRIPVLLSAGLAAVVLFGAGCSVEASIGTDETTTTTTKAAPSTQSSDTPDTEAPEVGTSETIGDYTLTMVDPADAGLEVPDGVTEVNAASITKGDQGIGLLLKYTVAGTVTDAQIQEILTQAGSGATVNPVTINGKQAYDVTLPSGQVVIARATEEGDIALAVGVPGVTEDQLGQAVADVTS